MEQQQKKRIKQYIAWALVVVLVIFLAFLPVIASNEQPETGPQASILSTTVQSRTISETISGGGNYGTIKTLNTAGKYIGLLWANHNNKIPTEGMVASGRIFVDGVEREINESNYMENLGYMKNPEVVTGITWVAPKN